MSVDLPAPLSPSRPTTSFRPTSKLTSCSALTSPKVLLMFTMRSRGSIDSSFSFAGRAGEPPARQTKGKRLADFLGRQRGQEVNIALVGEAAAGVDVQAGEGVLLGQAQLQDRQVALQVRLLVDDQLGPAALDGSDGGRREVEPGVVVLAGLLACGLQVGLGSVGKATVIGDDELDVRMG